MNLVNLEDVRKMARLKLVLETLEDVHALVQPGPLVLGHGFVHHTFIRIR